jgi:hypothetical protein
MIPDIEFSDGDIIEACGRIGKRKAGSFDGIGVSCLIYRGINGD